MAAPLGTGNQVQATSSYSVVDPWNLHSMYGPQFYDYKFIYNLTMLYEPPWFRTQKGIVGHVLGGWRIAPIFTFHSGGPIMVNTLNGDCQSFGEMNCSTGTTLDGAVLASKYTGGTSALYNQTVSQNTPRPGGREFELRQWRRWGEHVQQPECYLQRIPALHSWLQ